MAKVHLSQHPSSLIEKSGSQPSQDSTTLHDNKGLYISPAASHPICQAKPRQPYNASSSSAIWQQSLYRFGSQARALCGRANGEAMYYMWRQSYTVNSVQCLLVLDRFLHNGNWTDVVFLEWYAMTAKGSASILSGALTATPIAPMLDNAL